MEARRYSLSDRLFGEIDRAIKVLSSPARPRRELPGSAAAPSVLETAERQEAARLMRVNHAGEVAAQALYQGQALTARTEGVEAAMRHAADEEMDHLSWCETRIRELGGQTSVLNPLWYAGSFALGAFAGTLGDRLSLGFVAETESQVESHLRDHLSRLPAADHRSRVILEQMARDEMAHGAQATALGGTALPAAFRQMMRLTSRLMTRGSYWL